MGLSIDLTNTSFVGWHFADQMLYVKNVCRLIHQFDQISHFLSLKEGDTFT